MKIQKRKLSDLKERKDNPRRIDKLQLERLAESLRNDPEMINIRPVIINAAGEILGGTMRVRAAKKIGMEEIPTIEAKLTPEQEREFIVKDNMNFGEWDWDILGNEWDDEQLREWGLDVWQTEEEDIEYGLLGGEDLEGVLEDKTAGAKRAIQIPLTEEDYEVTMEIIGTLRKAGYYIGGLFLEHMKNQKTK